MHACTHMPIHRSTNATRCMYGYVRSWRRRPCCGCNGTVWRKPYERCASTQRPCGIRARAACATSDSHCWKILSRRPQASLPLTHSRPLEPRPWHRRLSPHSWTLRGGRDQGLHDGWACACGCTARAATGTAAGAAVLPSPVWAPRPRPGNPRWVRPSSHTTASATARTTSAAGVASKAYTKPGGRCASPAPTDPAGPGAASSESSRCTSIPVPPHHAPCASVKTTLARPMRARTPAIVLVHHRRTGHRRRRRCRWSRGHLGLDSLG
jgi:hypothetical protein